jgi:hypothetical protein
MKSVKIFSFFVIFLLAQVGCTVSDPEMMELLQEIKAQNDKLLEEVGKMKAQLDALDGKYQVILASLADNKKELEALKAQIDSLKGQIAQQLIKIDQLSAQLTQQGADIVKLSAEIADLKASCDELKALIEELLANKSPIPTNGLIAWYPFNGNANDESGNANNGTIMGGVSLTTDRLNNANKAYSFPGNSNSYIDCGSSNSLKITGSITMAAWIYLDGGYYNPRVLNYGNEGSGTNYQISMRGTSNVSRFLDGGIAMSNGQGSFFCCGPEGNGISIPALSWQHVAFTIDNLGVAKAYLNGKLMKTIQGTAVNESNYSNTTLNIGRKNQSAFDAFGGKIDDVGIWNRALTSEEVSKIYNGEKF